MIKESVENFRLTLGLGFVRAFVGVVSVGSLSPYYRNRVLHTCNCWFMWIALVSLWTT